MIKRPTKAQHILLVSFNGRGGLLPGGLAQRRMADRLEKLGLLETAEYDGKVIARLTPAGHEYLRARSTESCVHCGLTAEDHHDFEAIQRPAGCVCDDTDSWLGPVPPICAALKPDGDSRCLTCEHDVACHAARGAKP